MGLCPAAATVAQMLPAQLCGCRHTTWPGLYGGLQEPSCTLHMLCLNAVLTMVVPRERLLSEWVKHLGRLCACGCGWVLRCICAAPCLLHPCVRFWFVDGWHTGGICMPTDSASPHSMPPHGTPQVPALGCCCLFYSSSRSHNRLQHGMYVVDFDAARATCKACWEWYAVQTSLEQHISSCFLHHLRYVCCLLRPLADALADGYRE
jgi:hypothetical protein